MKILKTTEVIKIKTRALKDIMEFVGLSNKGVSDIINVDRTLISKVVNGKRNLSMSDAMKLTSHIKKEYKIDLDWKSLISEENRETVENMKEFKS